MIGGGIIDFVAKLIRPDIMVSVVIQVILLSLDSQRELIPVILKLALVELLEI